MLHVPHDPASCDPASLDPASPDPGSCDPANGNLAAGGLVGPGSAAAVPNHGEIRPVGAWVVGGFLLAAAVVIWALVSLIFLSRS